MLIYIAGAGAMGCRFGYQISKRNHKVILLDNWKEHVDSIKKHGLQISGDIEDTVHLPIMAPTEATEKADVIILFTKAMQLEGMLQNIQQIIDKDTKVLCLLNGLGHEDVVRKYVSDHNILMGVTVWTASLNGPGKVILQGTGTVNLQSINPENKKSGIEVVDLLNEAELGATYDDDVLPSIWRKACVNGTMNSLCALLDCSVGELFSSADGVKMVEEVIHEFVITAKSEGVDISEETIREYVIETSVKAAHHYPSMHQDLVQNHRLTEINYLNGAVVEKSKKASINTPYCNLITQLIHTKENTLHA